MIDPHSPRCTGATEFVDSDHPVVVEYAEQVCAAAGATTDRAKAVALFNAVRDGWRYDPYDVSYDPADYRASAVLASSANWCVPKSVLLTALCRAAGIPAALGFSDVKNHLQSEKLLAQMGTDLFVYHGYSLIWLDGRWRKASSAFNKELCERFGTKVLEFNGVDDALMHPYDESGNRHMQYINHRGDYDDLPLDDIFATFDEVYGERLRTGEGAR
ncbi:transglutaminase-like domain-containing protein [Cumulibacter manganitolerans]|uniref:transglutaminase-like domain-containing protein n=1 Tax=Cumulibacter manganitolerans TaxID=1884992 RepID=UPI001294B87A|nr:transglutaminase family protein [Cumulibacter manganitolerans]